MGNKPFKIAVRLDQPEGKCQAGDVISGKVYLSINRLSDAKHFQGIHLVLNGVERCQVSFKPGSLEYEKRIRHGKAAMERSSNTVVYADYPLVDLSNVTRGQYEYPFQLPLREDLPASMYCTTGNSKDSSFCEIKYSLTAYIANSAQPNSSSIQDAQLSHETILIMKGKPTQDPNPKPIRSETEIFPITSCWFWSQGHIAMGWACNQSIAAPGDNVHVNLWGENQSKLSIEYISVKWMETISWKTERPRNGGAPSTRSTKRLLSEQRHSVQQHPYWHSSKTVDQSSSCCTNDQVVLQSPNGEQGMITTTLKIPGNARETYRGSFVDVKHSLVVSVVTSGGYTSTTPEATIATTICRRDPTTNVFSSTTTAIPVAPSAPSELLDEPPVVQAHAVPDDWQPVLPEDWQPVEAEPVCLPLASAVVLPDIVDVTPIPTPVPSAPTAFHDSSKGDAARASTLPTTSSSPDRTFSELDQLAKLVADCPENLPVVLQDPEWSTRIQHLSPRDFCQFVQAGESQACMVARCLALQMGASFQTKHLLACLWTLPPRHRVTLLQDVAPLASDVDSKRAMIEEELSREELEVFQSALR